MANVIKIIDLKNQSEASIIDSILNENNIPHNIKSFHDSAYDGIWQTQYGWGILEAPEEYKDEIISIYKEIKKDI